MLKQVLEIKLGFWDSVSKKYSKNSYRDRIWDHVTTKEE